MHRSMAGLPAWGGGSPGQVRKEAAKAVFSSAGGQARHLSPSLVIFTNIPLMDAGLLSVKKIYNTAAYNNLDIYQVNCSYYSACGDDDHAYLLARAVQFFARGIPQVYYVGMLAGKNDLELLEETKVGRNINRHYYTEEEIDREVRRPVVMALIQMMKFRNISMMQEMSCRWFAWKRKK